MVTDLPVKQEFVLANVSHLRCDSALRAQGNGLPHQSVDWFAMTAKVQILRINRRWFSTNRVIASQCSHWRGNPFPCARRALSHRRCDIFSLINYNFTSLNYTTNPSI